jgi:hypothetical protein
MRVLFRYFFFLSDLIWSGHWGLYPKATCSSYSLLNTFSFSFSSFLRTRSFSSFPIPFSAIWTGWTYRK